MKKKKIKFEFPPDDKIEVLAYDLVKRLFDVEGTMITNESMLEDFMDFDEIPGHELRRFTSLSAEEQKIYRKTHTSELYFGKIENLLVWYPPVTEQEREQIEKERYDEFISLIKKEYGVLVPEILNGQTYLWIVAKLIAQRLREKQDKSSKIN